MDRLWYPVGNARDAVLREGAGAATRRYVSVNYAPPGASYVPAFSIGYFPLEDNEMPLLSLTSGSNHLGSMIGLSRIEEGAFLTAFYEGVQKGNLDQDGSLDLEGYVYSKWANVGGIQAVDDGNTDVDMTKGNVFTCTPAENTVFTTTSPTNGIGGQLACFVIDNSGGYDVSWSTGFTDITAIDSAETDVSLRLMQFDGTTWREVSGGAGVAYIDRFLWW